MASSVGPRAPPGPRPPSRSSRCQRRPRAVANSVASSNVTDQPESSGSPQRRSPARPRAQLQCRCLLRIALAASAPSTTPIAQCPAPIASQCVSASTLRPSCGAPSVNVCEGISRRSSLDPPRAGPARTGVSRPVGGRTGASRPVGVAARAVAGARPARAGRSWWCIAGLRQPGRFVFCRSRARERSDQPVTNTPHADHQPPAPARASLRRSLLAWLSTVRLDPPERYPHTTRISSALVNTRSGSRARCTSSSNSSLRRPPPDLHGDRASKSVDRERSDLERMAPVTAEGRAGEGSPADARGTRDRPPVWRGSRRRPLQRPAACPARAAPGPRRSRATTIPGGPELAGLAYLAQQLQRAGWRVQPSEHRERGGARPCQHTGVLGAAGQLDVKAVRHQLLDHRLGDAALGLDHEDRAHRRWVHQSSISRGLIARPWRAMRASTSLWIHGVGALAPPSGSSPTRLASQLVSPPRCPRSRLTRPQRIAISLMLSRSVSTARSTASRSARLSTIGLACTRASSAPRPAVETPASWRWRRAPGP